MDLFSEKLIFFENELRSCDRCLLTREIPRTNISSAASSIYLCIALYILYNTDVSFSSRPLITMLFCLRTLDSRNCFLIHQVLRSSISLLVSLFVHFRCKFGTNKMIKFFNAYYTEKTTNQTTLIVEAPIEFLPRLKAVM